MNIERLQRLHDLLVADAHNPKGVQFNLRSWAKPASVSTFYSLGTTVVTADCGTQACALGLAAISGAFKDDGLSYKFTEDGLLLPTFTKNNKVLYQFVAGANLFDIREATATILFDPFSYDETNLTGATAELVVAGRIAQLIDQGEDKFMSPTPGR